jgi:hypothetical protein
MPQSPRLRKSLLNPSPISPSQKTKNSPSGSSGSPYRIHQWRSQLQGVTKSVGQVEKCVGHMCLAVDAWENLRNQIRINHTRSPAQTPVSPQDWIRLASEMDFTPWAEFLRSPQTVEFMTHLFPRRNN